MLADFYNEKSINMTTYPINGVKEYEMRYCDSYEDYLQKIDNVI